MEKAFAYRKQDDNHYFPHEFHATRERGAFDEIHAWCREQFGSHGWAAVETTATFHTQTYRFAFTYDDEAFAFRMRWC